METTVDCKYIEGHAGTGRVAFRGYVKAGRGERAINISVDPQTIKSIARALEFTDSVGHAVWHVKNPDSALPCDMCKRQSVI